MDRNRFGRSNPHPREHSHLERDRAVSMIMETNQQLDELLTTAVQKGASDLHLSPGYYPTIRIDNVLVPISDGKILTHQCKKGCQTPF